MPSNDIKFDLGQGRKTQSIQFTGYQNPSIDVSQGDTATCANYRVNENDEYVLVDHLGKDLNCGFGSKISGTNLYTFSGCTMFFEVVKNYS